MNLDSTIETAVSRLPDSAVLSGMIDNASAYMPTDLGFGSIVKFLIFFAVGSLILSGLGRVVLGRRSSLNHSVSSVMAILFLYAVTIVIYTFQPWNLAQLLSPLPFVTFFNDYLVVLPIVGIRPTVLCRELLSLIILAFLVNLLDTFLPRGKSILNWYLIRFLMVILAMGMHLLLRWAFQTYLPGVLVTYAPAILLSILILMLTLGFLNAILGLVLTVANPIIGAIYTFFFSNIVGKQFTKAVFTSGILCVIVFLIGYFDYSFINISVASLSAYVPVVLVSLILWYLTGHLL